MGFVSYCKKEKRRLLIVLMISILLTGMLLFFAPDRSAMYMTENGRIVGIMTADKEAFAELSVTAEKDGVSVSRDVLIRRKKAEKNENTSYASSDEEELKILVDRAVRELSLPDDGELMLPGELSDGTELVWEKADSGKQYLFPLLGGPLLMFYWYRGEKEREEKRIKEHADGIIRSLPEFNNKVVLLLGSGMVFDDVISLIARGAETKNSADTIDGMLAAAKAEAEAVNGDTVAILSSKASKMHIRELSRMVNLICENRFTGADLAEKMSAEGEGLWACRKKRAEEKGRRAETGLALPMSVTLLALVAVSAAPAMMQI